MRQMIRQCGRQRRKIDRSQRILRKVYRKIGGRQGVITEVTLKRQRLAIRLQQETVQFTTVREQVLSWLRTTGQRRT